MRKLLNGTIVALGIAGAVVAITGPANAQAGIGVHVGDVGIGIGFGDVRYAYQDGYWDTGHRWHNWRNDDEMNAYRRHEGARYYDYRHDRDPDMGWHN